MNTYCNVMKMPVPIDRFVFQGFSVQKVLGEVPKLSFKIKINTVHPEDVPKIKYIYISHLECEITLNSTEDSEYAGSHSEEGYLGTYAINIGKLLQVGKSETIHLIIPVSSPKVDKFLEIRHKKRYLMFDIKISGYCLCYDSDYNLMNQIPIKRYTLNKIITGGEFSPYLTFNTDDFTKLMKEIKGYSLESIQIPVYEFKEQRFPSMKKAVKLLKSAYQNLSSGNELATVRDIRNLFLNYLTVSKKIKTEEETKYERFLRDEITEYILNKVPDSSKKVYKDVIKGLERDIRSICDVLSKFIHETDDKLINVPLHKDLEFLYLSTLSIVTYLAKHLE